MKICPSTVVLVLVGAIALQGTVPAGAGVVVTVGTGSGALVHNGTTKIDIMDPNDDNIIDTTEWGFAPTIVGPPTGVGNYNVWSGQSWARIFDNATGGDSKVCCGFDPGSTSVTVNSATSAYTLSGYTIATGADDHGRRPTGWRLFGSDDGFVASNVLLDTVTPADPNAPNNNFPWTANQQVGEVTALDNPGGSYSSFRIVFDENSTAGVSGNNGPFQLSEVELIGTLAPLEVGGNNNIGTFQPPLEETNVVGGARFVRVSEQSVVDGRLHISEIEVFNAGVTPNEAGQGSANGNPSLSTNDYNTGLSHHVATTTSNLQHGAPPTRVYDGDHESGGDVWSTNNVSSPDPRFTLDLGGTRGVGVVRVFPRNDNCCSERFENLKFDVFADDGTGNPGALLDTLTDSSPNGSSLLMREATFNIPLTSVDIMGTLKSDHTYVVELDALSGMSDLIQVVNPNPLIYGQAILDLNNATLKLELLPGAMPQPGDQWTLLAADQFQGGFGQIILPNTHIWDTSNLSVNGTLQYVAVPEPTTLLVWSLLAGLGVGFRWRRRK